MIFVFGFLKQRTKKYCVGDIIFLGKYPQTNSKDYLPIEWNILDIFEDVALLISKYAIIPSGYCNPDDGLEGIVWKNSLAQKECNVDFYNDAFSESEKQIICKRTTTQINLSSVTEYILCEDNVFILSEEETTLYMPDPMERRACSTEYTKSICDTAKWCIIDGYVPWWLLPQYDIGGTVTDETGKPYGGMIYPKAVNQKGEIQYHGRNAYHSDFAIRPCIQIDLNAYKKLV